MTNAIAKTSDHRNLNREERAPQARKHDSLDAMKEGVFPSTI
ncbi:MAG: hypothetical protein ACLPPV_24080 [Candidatus Korobacteraceae bacterium]|jgi:hypothetical protein